MDALVGFHVGFWDYLTFAGLFIILVVCAITGDSSSKSPELVVEI
jgi:hypothetical protein